MVERLESDHYGIQRKGLWEAEGGDDVLAAVHLFRSGAGAAIQAKEKAAGFLCV